MSTTGEHSASFDCFGSRCSVHVIGPGPRGSAAEAVAQAQSTMLSWHDRFSRFLPSSELSRLNADPRRVVPVSPMMARLIEAVALAGAMTDGLVDATLLGELQEAGYRHDLGSSVPLAEALALAPRRRPAAPASARRWSEIRLDAELRTVTRPPGLKLDSGGLAKGLFADALAESLAGHAGYAINCAGDLTIGGSAGIQRPIEVQSPFASVVLHTFRSPRTAVATSGIGRRSWLDADGQPAHHLLDPATGRPAFTGIVQVTALAPSGLLAEIRAKAAILAGPRGASRWLADGGVIVLEDGTHRVIEPPLQISLTRLSGGAHPRRKLQLQDA